MVATPVDRYWRSYHRVPGWFTWIDFMLFAMLLAEQARQNLPGDLLEIGTYQGRSAVLIGLHTRPHETFTVVDTFATADVDDANQTENVASYGGLEREQFERNYLRFNPELPRILHESSVHIMQRLAPHQHRFIHVDGSHLYEVASTDVDNAVQLLGPGGAVVCDDYRSAHTPGVAAAVWSLVYERRLFPFAVSGQKLYACASAEDASRAQTWLGDLLVDHSSLTFQCQRVFGRPLLIIDGTKEARIREGLKVRALRLAGKADWVPRLAERVRSYVPPTTGLRSVGHPAGAPAASPLHLLSPRPSTGLVHGRPRPERSDRRRSDAQVPHQDVSTHQA